MDTFLRLTDSEYVEIKQALLVDKEVTFINQETFQKKYHLSKDKAEMLLGKLLEDGVLMSKANDPRCYKKMDTWLYLKIRKIKLTFTHLHFALQKLEDSEKNSCSSCLKETLELMEQAYKRQEQHTFERAIQDFYSCLIRYTEIELLHKGKDNILELFLSERFNQEQVAKWHDLLGNLTKALQARYFSEGHSIIRQMMGAYIQLYIDKKAA